MKFVQIIQQKMITIFTLYNKYHKMNNIVYRTITENDLITPDTVRHANIKELSISLNNNVLLSKHNSSMTKIMSDIKLLDLPITPILPDGRRCYDESFKLIIKLAKDNKMTINLVLIKTNEIMHFNKNYDTSYTDPFYNINKKYDDLYFCCKNLCLFSFTCLFVCCLVFFQNTRFNFNSKILHNKILYIDTS